MNRARRTFLASAPALTAGLAALTRSTHLEAAPQGAPAPPHSSFDPWIEINAANLRHNVADISRRVSSRPVMAVIKNNGYGLGVTSVAALLEKEQSRASRS
jgi:hypothetical protein